MEKKILNSLYGTMAIEQFRKNYLLKLQFNINSIGFDFWLIAIRIYLKNRQISMMTLYNEIAKMTNKTASQIERAMRTASETAKENIKQLYDYNGKLSNKTILTLITKFEMKDNISNHIPRIDKKKGG